jgi:hypothetical protein
MRSRRTRRPKHGLCASKEIHQHLFLIEGRGPLAGTESHGPPLSQSPHADLGPTGGAPPFSGCRFVYAPRLVWTSVALRGRAE